MDKDLHEKAVNHAYAAHYCDFSGFLTKLILDDLRNTKPLPVVPEAPIVRRGPKGRDELIDVSKLPPHQKEAALALAKGKAKVA